MKEKCKKVIQKITSFCKRFSIAIIAGYVLLTGLLIFTQGWRAADYIYLKSKISFLNQTEKENQKLGEYVLDMMNIHKANLPEYQKQMLAQAIVRVSGNIFSNFQERAAATNLVANESNFKKNAKSDAGAVGLSQIMPAFVDEFAQHCNIKGINKDDLYDVETNLTLGFCRYKHLVEFFYKKSPERGEETARLTALAAYNGGKDAKSVKEFQNIVNISNEETSGYITKYVYSKSVADAYMQNRETKRSGFLPTITGK